MTRERSINPIDRVAYNITRGPTYSTTLAPLPPLTPSCCLNCHFDYEEEFALPHLAPHLRFELQLEHDAMRQEPPSKAALLAHSAKEMDYFRDAVPLDVIRRIESDHRLLTA